MSSYFDDIRNPAIERSAPVKLSLLVDHDDAFDYKLGKSQ